MQVYLRRNIRKAISARKTSLRGVNRLAHISIGAADQLQGETGWFDTFGFRLAGSKRTSVMPAVFQSGDVLSTQFNQAFEHTFSRAIFDGPNMEPKHHAGQRTKTDRENSNARAGRQLNPEYRIERGVRSKLGAVRPSASSPRRISPLFTGRISGSGSFSGSPAEYRAARLSS